MEGSAAPEPSDHRADVGTPASDDQGHDAGLSGVETEGQAEQPQAQPSTQEAVAPSPPRAGYLALRPSNRGKFFPAYFSRHILLFTSSLSFELLTPTLFLGLPSK